MDLRDHRCAFADCAADALHQTGAHVADHKHARNARLQRQRCVIAISNRKVLTLKTKSAGVRSAHSTEFDACGMAKKLLRRFSAEPYPRG